MESQRVRQWTISLPIHQISARQRTVPGCDASKLATCRQRPPHNEPKPGQMPTVCQAKLGAASRLAAVLFDDFANSAELDDAGRGMQAGSVKAYQSVLGACLTSPTRRVQHPRRNLWPFKKESGSACIKTLHNLRPAPRNGVRDARMQRIGAILRRHRHHCMGKSKSHGVHKKYTTS
jgi:hypothetical protein